MGLNPKSIKHHKENGTYRPGKHDRGPLGYYLEDIEPYIELKGEALRYFYEITSLMNDRLIMQPEDIPIYTHLALLWGSMIEAQEHIEKEGYTAIGSTGQVAQSAWYRIYMKSAADWLDLCTKLGIGPYGRTKLQVEDRTEAAQGPPRVDLN